MEWQFGNVRTHYDAGQWTAPFRCESIGLDGRLTFGLINGRLECVGVEFHAARPIASADLRIPWREGIAAAAKLIVATAEWQRAYVGVVNEAGEYLRPPLGLSAPEWDAVRASAATPGEVSECEPVEVPDPCSPPHAPGSAP